MNGKQAGERWEEKIQRAAHPLAYPTLRLLARRGPVVRVPRIGLVVSDAAIAREILLDTEHFSKVGPGSPSDLWTPVLGPAVLLNMEGEDHARLRQALAPLFTPRAVREVVAQNIGNHLDDLAPKLLAGTEIDLVPVVSHLAGTIICVFTGLEPTDNAVRQAMAAAQEVVGLVRLHRRQLTTRQVKRARAILAQLTRSAHDAYERGDPQTVPGRMRELGLSRHEALGAVGAFVLTGTETIQSFIPRLLALAIDTGFASEMLDAGPGRRTEIVDEALRITVPSPAMLRSVRRDTTVGNHRVRTGDRVVIATILCCRAYGPFDPNRSIDSDVRHLWFGAGPHFCIGRPLALAQVNAVLDALQPLQEAGAQLHIMGRRPARGGLIPAYRNLWLRAET
ncbi:MAG TPA: cytochrome P450 [Actinomycetales bacterium]|nr:cytochrome P450 [Actinomycetales bacterium]